MEGPEPEPDAERSQNHPTEKLAAGIAVCGRPVTHKDVPQLAVKPGGAHRENRCDDDDTHDPKRSLHSEISLAQSAR